MDYEQEADFGKKSKFNAGVAQTLRIDQAQRKLNEAKFNPMAMDMEYGTPCYKNLLTSLSIMVSEGWGKFTDVEKLDVHSLLNKLREIAKINPPVVPDGKGSQKLVQENYDKFLMLCEKLEFRIKELYEIHELNSPSKDEDDDYDY